MASSVWLEWGGDLVLTANGSVQMASGWDQTRQFFERALMTNPNSVASNGSPIPPDYIFEPNYGVGAGQFVGLNLLSSGIYSSFIQRVQQAAAVTPNLNTAIPPAVSTVEGQPHQFTSTITLTLINNKPGSVTLEFT